MRKEFHFSIIYALSRLAGIPERDSAIIANVSQFVDDNIYNLILKIKDTKNETLFVHCTPTAYKTQQVHKFIQQHTAFDPTIFFHFLPGDNDFITQPKSKIINTLKNYIFQNSNIYLLGIALHVIADAYAHQNFVGLYTKENKIRVLHWRKYISSFIKNIITILPPIGHSMAYFLPDIPNIVWGYKKNGKKYIIDNNEVFLQAIEYIYAILYEYKCTYYDTHIVPQPIEDVITLFKQILQKFPYNKKSAYKYIQKLIHTNFFNLSDFNQEGIDSIIEYSANTWIKNEIIYTKEKWYINFIRYILFKLQLKTYFTYNNKNAHYYNFVSALISYKAHIYFCLHNKYMVI